MSVSAGCSSFDFHLNLGQVELIAELELVDDVVEGAQLARQAQVVAAGSPDDPGAAPGLDHVGLRAALARAHEIAASDGMRQRKAVKVALAASSRAGAMARAASADGATDQAGEADEERRQDDVEEQVEKESHLPVHRGRAAAAARACSDGDERGGRRRS